MATSPTLNVASPDSQNSEQVSPRTIAPPQATKNEYFPGDTNTIGDGSGTSVRASEGDDGDNSSARKSSISVVVDHPITRISSIESSAGDISPSGIYERGSRASRKMSTSSVTFRESRDLRMPSLAKTNSLTKRNSVQRKPGSIRNPSPPPPEK